MFSREKTVTINSVSCNTEFKYENKTEIQIFKFKYENMR